MPFFPLTPDPKTKSVPSHHPVRGGINFEERPQAVHNNVNTPSLSTQGDTTTNMVEVKTTASLPFQGKDLVLARRSGVTLATDEQAHPRTLGVGA